MIILLITTIGYIVISLLWHHRESLDFEAFLENIWSKLFADITLDDIPWGILPLILIRYILAKASPREVRWAMRSLTFLIGIRVLTIFSYSLFSDDTVQDIVGIIGVIAFAIAFGYVVTLRYVPRSVDYFVRQLRAEADSPWRGNPWAWVFDIVTWIVLALLALFVMAVIGQHIRAAEIGGQQHLPGYYWIAVALVCYVWQAIFGASRWGTVGQQILGVRIVMQDTFKPLSLKYSALRTLVVASPAIAFLLLVGFGSSATINDTRPIQYGVAYAAALILSVGLLEGLLSSGFIRPEHPHGQGLVDLVMKTITVPLEHVQYSRVERGNYNPRQWCTYH